MTSAGNSISRFLALTWHERYILGLALMYLPLFQWCIRTFPLSLIIRLFSLKRVEEADFLLLEPSQSESQLHPAVELIRAILSGIDHRLPWWPGMCFAQALTARKLLRRYAISSTLYLGARTNKGLTLEAHAWLSVGNLVVTGREEKNSFTPLIAFH